MNIGYIEKEELWRSLPVYFFCFLIIGFLDMEGYISVGALGTFILAFLVTAIHFSLMVWYRKKEQIDNPSIFLIIDHIFRSESLKEKEVKNPKENSILSSFKENIILFIIMILLYIAYLYASLVYGIDQIFWILVLLFIGSILSKIIYSGRDANQKNPMRLLIFYIIVCVFIFARYLILGYTFLPILKGSIIVGILLVFLTLGIKWLHDKQNSGD